MYKKILGVIALTLGLSSIALAEDIGGSDFTSSSPNDYNPGIYFGGQVGLTNLHYRGSTYTLANSAYDDVYRLGARGFIGYAFTQFISTELGYDYYGRPKFIHSIGVSQDFLQQGMDLVLKANLPLDYGFALYVKGGLAWVHRGPLHRNNDFFAEKETNNKFTPVGALGIDYWFAPNIAIDLCWTKTITVSDLPTIDLATIGIIYKINI